MAFVFALVCLTSWKCCFCWPLPLHLLFDTVLCVDILFCLFETLAITDPAVLIEEICEWGGFSALSQSFVLNTALVQVWTEWIWGIPCVAGMQNNHCVTYVSVCNCLTSYTLVIHNIYIHISDFKLSSLISDSWMLLASDSVRIPPRHFCTLLVQIFH